MILAIDPGNVQSAWALVECGTCRPLWYGKGPNAEVRSMLRHDTSPDTTVAIEMIASYGMAVGVTVFETVLQVGRLVEICPRALLVYRADVKLHLCHTMKAKDGNIAQALVDRFAPGAPNRGKGTKRAPGWFYGFGADVWQAYALAVYTADTGAPGAAHG